MAKNNTIIIKTLPVLLNNLYIPVIKFKNGKQVPGIVKSKEAKEFVKLVQFEALRQKSKAFKWKT